MGRTPRRESATGYYHVVARGNRRQAVFQDAEDYAQYLRLLATAGATYGLHLGHYCLMPNHVHLLTQAPTLPARRRPRGGGITVSCKASASVLY